MGPMNDDDSSVTQTVAEVPTGSESQKDAGAVPERRDEQTGAEEWLVPGIAEEAGYGYGV